MSIKYVYSKLINPSNCKTKQSASNLKTKTIKYLENLHIAEKDYTAGVIAEHGSKNIRVPAGKNFEDPLNIEPRITYYIPNKDNCAKFVVSQAIKAYNQVAKFSS